MAQIGETLRKLRLEQGVTLKRLAETCGLSTSFLSQAERGLSSISVSTLERVCSALGLSLREFFAEADPAGVVDEAHAQVLRVADQPAVNLSDAAIKYRFLGREFPGRLFEVVIGEIPRGYVYPPASHEGEEFGYVVEGRLRLSLSDAEYDLGPGDSYHFGAHTVHGYEATGEQDVRVLWVQTLKDLKIRTGLL
ncbi:cupin domain-containing protein, partial [Candidatus Bipolaricaulota bacterium]|nr:cupin domain-containing protein [Candidatus Bipolaricaulota bacterium]